MNRSESAGQHRDDLSVSELEQDIRQTRDELGDTVSSLAARLDVKAQFKQSADRGRARILAAAKSHWPELAIVSIWAALVTVVWKKL